MAPLLGSGGQFPRVLGAGPRRHGAVFLLSHRFVDQRAQPHYADARSTRTLVNRNETFNTLTNRGHRFEHNFVHGNRHLGTVLMHPTMLAFPSDQIQQRCCRLFQAAVSAAKSKTRLWRKLRTRFGLCPIPNWEAFSRSIIRPPDIALGHSLATRRDRACSRCRLEGRTSELAASAASQRAARAPADRQRWPPSLKALASVVEGNCCGQDDIVDLSCRQSPACRVARGIDHRMNLGRQFAARAADRLRTDAIRTDAPVEPVTQLA
jgi:hypothetical protein